MSASYNACVENSITQCSCPAVFPKYISQANHLNCLGKNFQLLALLWGFPIEILVPKEQQWTKGIFFTLGPVSTFVTLFFFLFR